MRILIIYPGHSHSTIDVSRGYENALKELGHTVRAYNYHLQLAFYQEALKLWKRKNKHFKLDDPTEAMLILASEQAVVEAVDFVPDVVLIVSGFVLHRRAYALLDRLCLPLVLVLTESPYMDIEQANIIRDGHIALTFTNDKNSVEPLRVATSKRIEYLPHSYDPRRHHHKDAVLEKYDSDVFFFGTWWPERERLLKPVHKWARRHGYKSRIGGINHSKRKGMINNEEMVCYYSATKVAINHHRMISRVKNGQEVRVQNAWSLGPRAFEIAACGAFQLSDDTRPELREVFGDTVGTYSDAESLRNQVEFYLERPKRAEAMARAAYERVKPCSFANRAREIVLPHIEEVL